MCLLVTRQLLSEIYQQIAVFAVWARKGFSVWADVRVAEGIRLQVGATKETCHLVLAPGSEGGSVSATEGFLLNQCVCFVQYGGSGLCWGAVVVIKALSSGHGSFVPGDLVAPPTGLIHFELQEK